MNFSVNRDPAIEVPASDRSRISMMWLWLGLLGAPSAWVAQILLSEPIDAYACYPYQVPLSAPIWKELPVALAAINVACLTLALLSGFAAWTSWKRFEQGRAARAGEDSNRFLVKLSILSSFIFIVAVTFNICAVLLVPPCSPGFDSHVIDNQ